MGILSSAKFKKLRTKRSWLVVCNVIGLLKLMKATINLSQDIPCPDWRTTRISLMIKDNLPAIFTKRNFSHE